MLQNGVGCRTSSRNRGVCRVDASAREYGHGGLPSPVPPLCDLHLGRQVTLQRRFAKADPLDDRRDTGR